MAFFNDTQVIQKKDNSYGSCRLSYSSTCKSWFLLQEHDLIHHNFQPYHITKHMLQKQVRHPLIVVACFTWLLWVSSKKFLTYATTTTWYANCYLPFIRTLFIESDLTKVGETDTRQPPYATSACLSVEPVSRKRTCKVGPGRFIPRCRWNKIGLVTVSILNKINAHNYFVFYSCKESTQ